MVLRHIKPISRPVSHAAAFSTLPSFIASPVGIPHLQWFSATTICTGKPLELELFSIDVTYLAFHHCGCCTAVAEGVLGNGRLEGGWHYLESSGAHLHQSFNFFHFWCVIAPELIFLCNCTRAQIFAHLVCICTKTFGAHLHQSCCTIRQMGGSHKFALTQL